MARSSTVFVVDDDRGVLDSMRWLLESEGLAVETYSSGRQFLEAYDPRRPGCLLLDVGMPEMDGLELQQQLASRGGHPPIIFIAAHGDVPKCVAAMKAGALDFLEKPAADARVLELVRRALEQDRRRRGTAVSHGKIVAHIDQLTPREREVMGLLYRGKSIKAIAALCGIGFQTAAKHRAQVFQKLQVENEAELVRLLMSDPLRRPGNGTSPPEHRAP
ncbi:MAG: response regulator [Thermoguttaceae bacterium]|jgi:two-component system response regulator TtrR